MVEDLQERLDEAKAEIASKRKDEKDLKSKDRAQTIQIAGVSDFGARRALLMLFAPVRSRYLEFAEKPRGRKGESCQYEQDVQLAVWYVTSLSLQSTPSRGADRLDEAQRLRDLLRDRDEEIERLEDASIMHEGEENKVRLRVGGSSWRVRSRLNDRQYSREVEALEGEVKRLEQDLRVARQAESHLEAQKQENLQLKETIDRMRFDLEEARSQNAAHGHSRGATSSGAGTMSRNLGAEISRRLFEAEDSEVPKEGAEEREEDDYVETVVTTHRTRVSNKTRSLDAIDICRKPVSKQLIISLKLVRQQLVLVASER